jgi:hypothetical protein
MPGNGRPRAGDADPATADKVESGAGEEEDVQLTEADSERWAGSRGSRRQESNPARVCRLLRREGDSLESLTLNARQGITVRLVWATSGTASGVQAQQIYASTAKVGWTGRRSSSSY